MQKVRKAKRKRLEHRDIQSPRRDRGAPAEDSIRPMKNDKFPNKMRLLTWLIWWQCATVPRNMTMIKLTVPAVGRNVGGNSNSHRKAQPSSGLGFNQLSVIRVNKVI